ncbi:hypothetical protein EC968_007850, partial [Mortierella alpina]
MASPTEQFLKQLHKIIRDFMCTFKPQAYWSVITSPRTDCGLGVIDPDTQTRPFDLKQFVSMTSNRVSWGKEVLLNIITMENEIRSRPGHSSGTQG